MAITSDVKLAIYNGALRRLGSRKLASLSENREPRRVLDDVWGGSDEVVDYALERGEWNFALRATEAIYSSSITPTFGFRRAYTKPDDFCRLAALSADPYFNIPLTHDQYAEEAGYWLTDHDVLYVKWVSNHTDYGFDSAKWTQGFRYFLQSYMAWESCERITNSTSKRDRLERDMMRFLKEAKSTDAMGDGVKFLKHGSWSTSRYTNRREGSRLR